LCDHWADSHGETMWIECSETPSGALAGVRVLDLSRILAGPSCTQMLGDLGADVIKVERPGHGDDTRRWGPPWQAEADGQPGSQSAYYLAANRNKRSVALDLANPDDRAVLHRLLVDADVLVENYKVGDLARHGLAPADLLARFPRLVVCSITGFGQTGPEATRTGYDFLVQGLGGIMSVTGPQDGAPTKLGVGIADLYTGMHAAVAILAALRHRDRTGRGQLIDLALLDCQLAMLANVATAHLMTGEEPVRHGNGHPHIVPYDVFPTADGHMILAVGNDGQFRRLCEAAGDAALADADGFFTNADRVRNRPAVNAAVGRLTLQRSTADWVEMLERVEVPCGPVRTVGEAFADPQATARGMVVTMEAPGAAAPLRLVANPIRLSATPPTYRAPPPRLGEHDAALANLRDHGEGRP